MKRGATILSLAVLITACGGGQVVEQARAGAPYAPFDAPDIAAPTRRAEVGPSRQVWAGFGDEHAANTALVALTRGETPVFGQPGDTEPVLVMPWTTILGTATVMTIVGEPAGGWAEVMLPIRPNGSTGWIRTADVAIYVVAGRIVVDLSDRTLTYLVNGRETLTSAVAIGKGAFPTPTGHFFVTDSVTVTKSGGPWGPHALGLSARSDTITEFNGGDGIIGIHGTNNPASIGRAASLGCVRLPNELITELHSMVPIGTPVEIRA